jgi:hypothetical protein
LFAGIRVQLYATGLGLYPFPGKFASAGT